MPIARPRRRTVTKAIASSVLWLAALLPMLRPSTADAEVLAPADELARQLVAHEQAAWDKYVHRDIAGSRPLLAADYADVQTDGTVLDREGHLAFVPQANVEWHALDRFLVIRLAPDAALVTYRARARDRGSDSVYQADVSSGWSRRQGRWLNTFYRETPTAPEAAPAQRSP